MGFQRSRRRTYYPRKNYAQQGQHARRITEEQRRATEEAYLYSLRQQHHRRVMQQSSYMTPKDKKERNFWILLGSLIVVGVIIFFGLIATYISPPEINTYPVASPIATDTTAGFCQTHTCIPNFPNGKGYIIECRDGEYSHSGGLPGACSDHGGEIRP